MTFNWHQLKKVFSFRHMWSSMRNWNLKLFAQAHTQWKTLLNSLLRYEKYLLIYFQTQTYFVSWGKSLDVVVIGQKSAILLWNVVTCTRNFITNIRRLLRLVPSFYWWHSIVHKWHCTLNHPLNISPQVWWLFGCLSANMHTPKPATGRVLIARPQKYVA